MSGIRSYPRQTPVENYQYKNLTAAQASPTQINTANRAAVLGRVTVNTVGTTPVLILTDGNGGPQIAKISPTAVGFIEFGVVATSGLFYTLSGSGMDITVGWLDQNPIV